MRVMKKMCASVDDSEVRSFLVDDDARPKSLYYVRRIPTLYCTVGYFLDSCSTTEIANSSEKPVLCDRY